jgi:AcrR family transcriptional regulator
MEAVDASRPKPGLRERKKQQTRETIERVALKLFAERGYDETTLADIAEAADISPRTIFAYFESKDDILFCEEDSFLDRMKETLDRRPPGSTTVDALRDFISSFPPPDAQAMLRKKVIMVTPDLRMRMRAHLGQLEPLLVESIAKDLGAGPGDVRPRLIAASMTAAFATVRDRLESSTDEPNHEDVMEIIEQMLEFLQGGLEALQNS